MHSYADVVGQDLVLMNEYPCPHRASSSTLSAKEIERMDWAAPSPDVNPIEHVWDILQRWITARPAQPQPWEDFAQALI